MESTNHLEIILTHLLRIAKQLAYLQFIGLPFKCELAITGVSPRKQFYMWCCITQFEFIRHFQLFNPHPPLLSQWLGSRSCFCYSPLKLEFCIYLNYRNKEYTHGIWKKFWLRPFSCTFDVWKSRSDMYEYL